MRKMSNEELSEMSREELIEKLVQVNAVFSDADDKEVLKAKLKEISHTRHLKIWHDLSTVANRGGSRPMPTMRMHRSKLRNHVA
jgi:ferredoxin-fold anticodon binding domain-containing protein